jgi:hypothetical protein
MTTSTTFDWIHKLSFRVDCTEFGSCTFTIDWDETDPDLAEWIGWGEEKQKQFILDNLNTHLQSLKATKDVD